METKNKLKIGLVIAMYLIMLFFWSRPISDLPFGDVDASVHFTLSDYQSQHNQVIVNLPYNINFIYGHQNNGKIWYTPQFHIAGAISQLVGGRIYGIFFFYLLTSTLIFITLFLLIYKLYGYWPALLSSSLLIFSLRDYTTYLWGLWPEKAGFIFTPVILYCLYKYYDSYLDKKPQNIYLWLLPFLISSQFFMHPEGLFISSILTFVFTALIIIKEKRLPFSISKSIITMIILLILVAPYIQYPLAFQKNVNEQRLGDKFQIQQLGSLLHWYPQEIPYRPDFGKFNLMHGGWWLLPFVLLGIAYLLFNRKRRDLAMLAWLITYYALTHLNVIGYSSRIHRFINFEAHVIYPIAILGLFFLLSSLPDNIKKYDKAIACGLTALFLINTAIPTIPNLYNAYSGIYRVTPAEMQACEWIDQNLPEDAHIRDIGTVVYSNRKWIQSLSFRHFIFDDNTLDASESPELNMTTHLFIDNDNLIKAGAQPLALNATPIYSKNNIEVYQLGSG